MQFPDAPFVPEPVRGGSFAVVYGAFLGSEPKGRALLRPVRELGPAMDTFAMVAPAALGDMAMDPPDPLPFVTTTALLSDLPRAGVDDLVAAVGPESGSHLAMVELRQLGGALARQTPGAGARATLPGTLSLIALGVPEDAATEAVARAYLESLDQRRPPLPRRRLPELRHGADRREPLLRRRHLGAPAPGEGALRPDDLFKGNHHIPPA